MTGGQAEGLLNCIECVICGIIAHPIAKSFKSQVAKMERKSSFQRLPDLAILGELCA
jgi:hypothetical protein